ncbi:unnamed protein product, partial [Polarella glacialis]
PGSLPQQRLCIQFRKALLGTIWEREEPWLAELLDGLLAPAPEDRFSSAAEASGFLQRARLCGGKQGGLPPGSEVALPSSSLDPPRGSGVRVERSGFNLRVLFPPPDLGDSLPTGAFAIAWTAFTAVWTAGVLSAGAPVMALFSLPFWGAGGSLLKDGFGPLLRGATELRIGRDEWSYGRLGSNKPIAEGSTAQLLCRDASLAARGSLTLEEGVLEQRCGQGLRPVERD